MKLKTLALLMAAGMAASAFGQGIILDNTGNSGAVGAMTSGQVYMPGGVLFDGMTYNLGVTVMGGATAGSLAPMGTFTAATDSKGYTGAALGQFQLGPAFAAVNVPGIVAGTATAWIQLQIWYDGAGGLFNSFAAASSGGGLVGTVLWEAGLSNPLANPPVPAPNFGGMPSVTLAIVPEPSTLALAGLGLVSLLALRRRS